MKSFLKCLATGMAIVLVFCLIITTVLLRSGQEVRANVSFDGINNIIEANSEGHPYTIYELVPDANMGEIGYLIEGQEPINWKNELKDRVGSQSRKDYVNIELRNLLDSIVAEDASRPITYKPYDESYLEKDNWDSYILSNPDIIPSGTSGYGMIENLDGADYTLSYTYVVNEQAQGQYNQNVLYYQYASTGGYYGIKFEQAFPVIDAETGRLVPRDADGRDIVLYRIIDSYPIISQESFDDIKANTPNAYIYRIGLENLRGAYEFVGKIGSGTFDFTDFEENYLYYTVTFEYVGEEPELSEDTVYYQAYENEFFNDRTGEYSGILDTLIPYIEVGSESTTPSSPQEPETPTTPEGGESGENNQESETPTAPEGGEGSENNQESETPSTPEGGEGSENNQESETPSTPEGGESGENNQESETPSTPEGGENGENNQESETPSTPIQPETPQEPETPVQPETAGGHFDRDESQTHYEYIGGGNGKYDLRIGHDEDVLTAPLYLSKVYYTGGFTNNNWFKYGVFDQDGMITNSSREMYFNVETLIPEQLNQRDVNACDLLYISSNAFHNNGTEDVRRFGSDNDITWQQLCNIMTLVQSQSHFPVVVDYSILEDGVSDLAHATNLKKLVALLCSQNMLGYLFTPETTADSIDWNDISSTIVNDQDHHFVNNNIYVYPGNSDYKSPFMILDNTTQSVNYFTTPFISYNRTFNDVTAFENEAEQKGFGGIAAKIDSQNLSRRTENEALGSEEYPYFDLKISKAIAMEYIISYTDEDTSVEAASSISILDIEPCYVTDTTSDALQKSTVQSWFAGRDVPEISITHMSTAEFIGNIVDISTYDMVHIGMSVNMLQTINGSTVYNDSRMNGMIYTNVGDIAVLPTDHTGMLETDYNHNQTGNRTGVIGLGNDNKYNNPMSTYANANNTYRYSGNDITKEKMEALREYVYAGYPLIVANKFYKNPSEKDEVDAEYVDNCSYMYELFNGTYDNQNNLIINGLDVYNNVMTVKQASENFRNLYNYLNLGKPKINLIEQGLVPGTEYVQLNTNVITLDFSISNRGSADAEATFDPILYLDTNADGKFSNTQEYISATDIRIYDNGTLVRPIVLETDISDEGEARSEYRLMAGVEHSYRLTYTLPENYVGIIPWRLKLTQSSNKYRYDLKQGFFYYKPANQEPINIRILQIGSSSDERFNMRDQANNANSKFAQALAQVTDYNLTISYMKSNVFGNECAGKTVKYFEDNYDMIVMGFTDMYKIDDINGSIGIIKDYINRGNPILFTHDTTSFCNNSTNHGGWGYYFNSEIRNLVGMDRYGILESEALKVGLELEKGSSLSKRVANTNYNIGTLYNKAVEYAEQNNTDIAYLPGSNRKTIVKQNQGDASGDMVRYAKGQTNYNHYFYLKNGSTNYHMETTKVQKVNSGQITSYPFILPDNFDVATTHAQYYQIDMNEDADKDGESDVVVWYTLNSSDFYGKSPKDVRNNYYIYTKGNVTYSGVGHRTGISENENEVKLYINTMIAAYKAGTHAPKITIKESDEEDAQVLNTIYESFDQTVDENGVISSDVESIEQSVSQANQGADAIEKIYFTVKDTNIVRNVKRKEIRVDFCIPVDQTEYDSTNSQYTIVNDSSGNPIYLKKLDNIKRYRKNAEGQYEEINTYYKSGLTYQADIPLSLLPSDSNYVDIYAVVKTTIIKNNNDGTEGEPVDTSASYSTVRIQKIGLTDLD